MYILKVKENFRPFFVEWSPESLIRKIHGGFIIEKRVCLFYQERPELSVSISAYIHPVSKALMIEGQDSGEFIQNSHGNLSYECRVIIPAEEKLKLLSSLQEKGFGNEDWKPWVSDDIRLLNAVRSRFGGNNQTIHEIQKLCSEIGIRSEFHSDK